MRRILITAILIFLCASPVSHAKKMLAVQTPATENDRASARRAPTGFYLEIKRSYVRAYPGWQKKTIALLKAKGFVAFNGYPRGQTTVDDNMPSVESVEKTARPVNPVSPVYVGPYHTREEAEERIPSLLSALKPLIDDEKKDDGLRNRYLFLVGVVQVL